MAIGIELARVIGPLTPFPRKVLNAKSAIRDKNRHVKAHDQGCEKTRYMAPNAERKLYSRSRMKTEVLAGMQSDGTTIGIKGLSPTTALLNPANQPTRNGSGVMGEIITVQ